MELKIVSAKATVGKKCLYKMQKQFNYVVWYYSCFHESGGDLGRGLWRTGEATVVIVKLWKNWMQRMNNTYSCLLKTFHF